MRVRMKVNLNYCPDGIQLHRAAAGESVDVPDHIARVWLSDGRAEQDKMMDAAPQFKTEGIKFDHVGPKNATLEVFQGTAPFPPPPAGVTLTEADRKRLTKEAKKKGK